MRPTNFRVGNTIYWTLMTYDANGVRIDADSTPTVTVRKNGASVGDVVTITKRAVTTGIYDCSYNPAGEQEGDLFEIEETAVISAVTYDQTWSIECQAIAFDATTDAVDVGSLSGSTAAADNIESQYDGVTGLSGDVFPATQASVANIGSGTAGAVNFEATSDNTSAPIKGVSFVGSVVSGTLANTSVEDGVAYEINDVGNDIDLVFGYDIGGDNQGVEVEIVANVNGNADRMVIKAYDFNASGWDTIGTIEGSGGTSYTRLNLSLLARHTGTGADLGNVYIRFDTEATTPASLFVDKVIVGSVTTTRSVGYSNGSIWISSTKGVAGTEPFVNGVADNPCLNYANAIAIASTVGLSRYTFDAGDSITLTQSHATDSFSGYNYQLDMNNQAPPTYVEGAEITGTCNGPAAHYVRDCRIGTVSSPLTLNRGAVFVNSGLVNVDLLDQAGAALDIEFLDCHGNTQGSMFPGGSLDFGTTAGTNHEVSFQRWGGPVTIVNLKDGDTVYAHGNGTFILDASCTGGSFRVAGMINLIDNSAGAVSVLEDGRITRSGIADSVWDESLSTHIGAGSAGLYLLDSGSVALKLNSSLEADGLGGWQYTTLALENAPSGGGLTVQQIVDGVWDEPQSSHLVAGSFGVYLNSDVSAIRTVVDDTANDVIDIQNTLSSTGVVLTPAERSTIVDLVWDEQTSGHTTSGSTGANLIATGQGVVNIETVTDRVDGMLVINGEGSAYQYTVDALENAPVSSGTGLYQATVRVQDSLGDALQGARVNVDGTTLTLTTGTSGEVTFNLDSGVYLMDVSPPAGYDTPVSQVVTITTSDPATTVYTLTETSTGGGCTPPWIG